MTAPSQSSLQAVLTRITAPRPTVLKVLVGLGIADVAHGLLFSISEATTRPETFVALMSLMLLEGMLLLMVWRGGRAARGGLVAYHAIMLGLSLLSAAGGSSQDGAGSGTVAMVTGMLLSVAVLAASLRGELSAWLRDVVERRRALPVDEQRVLVKATAQLALVWVLAPVLMLKGLSRLESAEGLSVLVLTVPVVVTGLMVLAFQAGRWLSLRKS